MSGKRRITVLLVVAASLAILVSILIARRSRFNQPGVITGVVLRRDPDARDQLPIAGAEVTILDAAADKLDAIQADVGERLNLQLE